MDNLTIEQSIIREMLSRVSTPHDGKRVAFILRGARASGLYDFALREAATVRAGWLAWLTNTQRQWQAKVSRRPSRCKCRAVGRGDAWEYRDDPEKWVTRENYVTLRDVNVWRTQGATVANVRAMYGAKARPRSNVALALAA